MLSLKKRVYQQKSFPAEYYRAKVIALNCGLEPILGGSRLVNRNITAGAGRTSMRLEPEVWDALREICLREGIELRDLIKQVEQTASPGGRTSAVRVHVLDYFRNAATHEGHIRAGHGTKTATGPIRLLSEIEVESTLTLDA